MKNSLILQIAILCLTISIAKTQLNSNQANITFAPPPPLNTTVVGILNNSINDDRFIGSKRLQALQLNLLPPVAGVSSTNFRLVSFDRNGPNNTRVFQFNQTGNWTIVSTTQDSLSCSLALELNTQSYGFVQFANNNLQMVYRSNSTLNSSNTANIALKQNCFVYMNGVLNSVSPSGLSPVSTPANWAVASTPQSINYGIANNNLHRFNPNTLNYTSIYTFPSSSFYDIRASQGNLVVAASNISANLTLINQTFFVLTDQNLSLSLISQFSISGKNLANLSIIPYLTSPQLSKLGVNFVPANSTNNTNQVSILKTINFVKKTIGDLTFQQPNRFLATTATIPPGNRDFAFGDNYYIVRNGTAPNTTVNQSLVEEAYQFVSDKVIFLRNRLLDGKELTDYRRTFVDISNQNQLVVLNTYALPNGLEIDQFVYGNLVSINRIIPTTTPPFITFAVPTNTFNLVLKNSFSWNYLNTVANVTNLTIITANTNFQNNVQITLSSFPGNQTILVMNNKCLILKEADSGNINIARPPANVNGSTNASVPFTLQDVTQALSSANVTSNASSNWIVSDLCDRFAVDNKVFTRTLNQSYIPLPLPRLPSSLDKNLSVAVIGNDIWSLSPLNNTFVLALNNSLLLSQNGTNATNNTNGPLPPPILPMNKVYTANNLIVITATNNTAGQVYAYSVGMNGMIRPLLNFYFPAYQSTPKILVSSKLTKVLIMGPFIPPNQTQVQPKIDSFFIDSPNNGFQNITFPFNSIPDPVNSFVLLDDQYLYVRSLTTNFSNSPNGTQPQQNIFFISQDVAPQNAYSVNLTQDQVNLFKRVIFGIKPDGSVDIFVESLNGTQVVVKKLQISPKQAALNQNSNIIGLSAMIGDDGSIRLCSPGCSSCASGTCSGCVSSYVFDSTNYICYRCGQNCAACSLSNTLICSSCNPGSFLTVNSTCLKCQGCKQCSGSATNCTGCPPSKYFFNGTCNNNCSRNCIFCLDGNTCQTCAKGFVYNNGTCRGCGMSCSNCSATNITQCTSCAPGLSLVNSTCVQCPEKCQTCNNGICATCIPGFTPNTAGVCVLNCAISCATCVDNQPTTCLTCYGGANLINGTCVLDITCNGNSSCSYCGQGLGYVISGTNCIQCPNISNCLQCSSTNTDNCSICLNGYYIDTTDYSCQACSTGCFLCTSADICSACAIGYTLPQNSTLGQCLQCQSPCATCLGVTTYCLTCISGFTKRGWKCQNNTYSGFKFTLSDTPANILGNIDFIVNRLLVILNISTTNVDAITFSTIVSGSTVVQGTATTDDPAVATATLAASLSSGTFGNYTVTSVSVTTAGTSSEQQKKNVGLIVGLVIGLVVLVVIVVIVIYYVYKKKKASKVNEGQDGHIVIQMEHDSKLKNQSKHESQNFVIRPNNAPGEKEMF